MSRISNAIVETLLEEITDYDLVGLSEEQLEALFNIADRWEDRESIESEINCFLLDNGYTYNLEKFIWERKNKTKYKRVFQIGFDVAEGFNVPSDEIESLWLALEDHINNFYNSNGNRIEFRSVGSYNVADMSHAYKEEDLKELN